MQNPIPQEQFLDLYRTGIRSAADVGQAWLQVSLRLHEKQMEAVRGMVDENARSAERLGEAKTIQDLFSVQSRLAGEQMQRMGRLWSTMWQAAAENGQAEFATRSAAGSMRESAQAAQHGRQEHRKTA